MTNPLNLLSQIGFADSELKRVELASGRLNLSIELWDARLCSITAERCVCIEHLGAYSLSGARISPELDDWSKQRGAGQFTDLASVDLQLLELFDTDCECCLRALIVGLPEIQLVGAKC